jgi:HAMP domain-containing protein
MRISLCGRLVLWHLLTIPVLVFALVFTAHEIMVFSMRQGLDNSLKKRADLTANAISPIVSANPGSYPQAVKQLTEDQLSSIPLLLRISDGNEYVLASFGDIPASILPRLDALLSSANADEGTFHTISVKGEETLRVYTVALETPAVSEPLVLIQTGDSLSHIAVAENQLWRYGIGAGAAGTVLILGVEFFILQWGFRPLDRILNRVEEIGRGNLQDGLLEEPRPPELQQLANSLNTMWQRLDEVFNVREAFFASVSHGLRSPLTALQGQIDVLLIQGTGLGLAIVKSVVELHDGHIEIQSQVGVGTRVRVSLPRLSCNGQRESMEDLEASGMKVPHREASDLHRGSGSP